MLAQGRIVVYYNKDRSAVNDSNVKQAERTLVLASLDTMSNRSHVSGELAKSLPALDRLPDRVKGLHSLGPLSGWKALFCKDRYGRVVCLPALVTREMSAPLLLSAGALQRLGIDTNRHLEVAALAKNSPGPVIYLKGEERKGESESFKESKKNDIDKMTSTGLGTALTTSTSSEAGSTPFWESFEHA